MALVKKSIEIYDNSGLIEVQTIMVEETPIEDLILSKEDELLRVYNELEALRNR
jgi:hypothetical protein